MAALFHEANLVEVRDVPCHSTVICYASVSVRRYRWGAWFEGGEESLLA